MSCWLAVPVASYIPAHPPSISSEAATRILRPHVDRCGAMDAYWAFTRKWARRFLPQQSSVCSVQSGRSSP